MTVHLKNTNTVIYRNPSRIRDNGEVTRWNRVHCILLVSTTILKLELMVNSNSRNGIVIKKGIGIDKSGIGIEVSFKKLNPQIILSFSFLIQNYLFNGPPPGWRLYTELTTPPCKKKPVM